MCFTLIFTVTIQLTCQSSAVCLKAEMHRWNYRFEFHLGDIHV